jgi:hypothetical protein
LLLALLERRLVRFSTTMGLFARDILQLDRREALRELGFGEFGFLDAACAAAVASDGYWAGCGAIEDVGWGGVCRCIVDGSGCIRGSGGRRRFVGVMRGWGFTTVGTIRATGLSVLILCARARRSLMLRRQGGSFRELFHGHWSWLFDGREVIIE